MKLASVFTVHLARRWRDLHEGSLVGAVEALSSSVSSSRCKTLEIFACSPPRWLAKDPPEDNEALSRRLARHRRQCAVLKLFDGAQEVSGLLRNMLLDYQPVSDPDHVTEAGALVCLRQGSALEDLQGRDPMCFAEDAEAEDGLMTSSDGQTGILLRVKCLPEALHCLLSDDLINPSPSPPPSV